MAERYVVTGGGGFVGRALALALRRAGHSVLVVARGAYPELHEHGIETVRADISAQPNPLREVCQGASAVFHVAAKVEMWGPYREFFNVNVVGTRNVIDACRYAQVHKLIFTSSPSVIADGTDLCGVNEDYPYPKRYHAYYPQTKAQAEREVLAASDSRLWTVALRPHLIWGPGDTNLIPTVLRKAQAGKLVQIGNGENLVDTTYIDDCVAAHLCAERALEHEPRVRGQPFFISQGEPIPLWWWVNQVLQRNGLPPIHRRVAFRTAYRVAAVCELIARAMPGVREPLLTRFLVSEMATAHFFDISRARELLGYRPSVSVAEGLERTFGAAMSAAAHG